MTRTKTVATLIGMNLTAAAAILGLAGCGTHASGPDPATGNTRPGTNQRVIQDPYGYRNVAFSCNGTVGVYVTSAGADDSLPSTVAVLANDPNCTGR